MRFAYSLAFTCECGHHNPRPWVYYRNGVQFAECRWCRAPTAAERICSPGDRKARAMRDAERRCGVRL